MQSFLSQKFRPCNRYLGKVSKGQMRGIDEAVKVQLGYYIPEQAEKKRQGKCRKEVNFDGG